MSRVTDALTAVPTSKAPTVEPEEELPEIDETTIDGYSQEVRTPKLVGFQPHTSITLMARRNENLLQPN
jgi:hypothetical protein